MDMVLDKKTTILFPPDLYSHLAQVAALRGVSVGLLVREACVNQYGRSAPEDRVAAATALAELALPVKDVAAMKRESVPEADDELP